MTFPKIIDNVVLSTCMDDAPPIEVPPLDGRRFEHDCVVHVVLITFENTYGTMTFKAICGQYASTYWETQKDVTCLICLATT